MEVGSARLASRAAPREGPKRSEAEADSPAGGARPEGLDRDGSVPVSPAVPKVTARQRSPRKGLLTSRR